MGTNWKAGLIRWKPHVTSDAVYSLAHLHPFRFEIQLPNSTQYAALHVTISVGFSHHCFTRAQSAADRDEDAYSDDRERRTFDIARFELSQLLPHIIRSLPQRHCHFAKAENFVVIESAFVSEAPIKYAVFFTLRGVRRDGEKMVELIVQSAYPLDDGKQAPGTSRITFYALVGHAMRGTTPKRPR